MNRDHKHFGPNFGPNYFRKPSTSFKIEKFYPRVLPSEDIPNEPYLRYPMVYNFKQSNGVNTLTGSDNLCFTSSNLFFSINIQYNMNEPFPLYNMNGTLSNVSLPVVPTGTTFVIRCTLNGVILNWSALNPNFKYVKLKTVNDNLYISGTTYDVPTAIPIYNFSTSIGSPQFTIPSQAIWTIIKFNTNGSAISWSTTINSYRIDNFYNVSIIGSDSSGNLYVKIQGYINDVNVSNTPVTCYSFSSTNSLGSNTLNIPAQNTNSGYGVITIVYDSSLNPTYWTFGSQLTSFDSTINGNTLYVQYVGLNGLTGNTFNFYPSTNDNNILNSPQFTFSFAFFDTFIFKYDLSSKTVTSWTKIDHLGGNTRIKLDSFGNLYLSYNLSDPNKQIRNFSTTNTIPSVVYTTPTFPSNYYNILIKYVNDVPTYWYFNSYVENINSIEFDANGNLYLSCETRSSTNISIYNLALMPNNPVSSLSFTIPTTYGASYIIKFNSLGNALGYYPITCYDYFAIFNLYIDSSNNLYGLLDCYDDSSENGLMYNLSTTLGSPSKEMVPLDPNNFDSDNYSIIKWNSSGIIQ